MLSLKDLAIKKALENNWQEACIVNQQILDQNPEDIDTLNRLAFSFLKLGKFKRAKETYKKVLEIDRTNPIALKNLQKIDSILKQHIKKDQILEDVNHVKMQDLFIEEAGRTKTIELKNIADKKFLTLLQPGDSVSISVKRSKIFIQSNDNRYIGMLPDNVGMRLIQFIKGGNEYRAYIKSLGDKSVSIFVKEIKRSTRYKNQPSFTALCQTYQSQGNDND